MKVSSNGRYLVDQKDVPFLIVGDTPQGLMGRLTEPQAEFYFANRQAHGFNTMGWIDVACAGSDYRDNKEGGTPDGIRPYTGFVAGGKDFAHYDLTKPNEAYFARLDRVVTLAAKHGLLVFIDPIETIGWLPTLRNNGLASAYSYGQYLGRRYKRFTNVAWLNGNDFNSWKDPKDDALVQAVAKGIKSEDPAHLQTAELNVCTSSTLDDPTWAPIISLNATYTYSPTYMQMLHSYNQSPVVPTFLVEAHYDWEDVGKPPDFGTPSVLRREEYWTMLTGGTGQFYGNKYTWSFAPGWESHIDTVGVTPAYDLEEVLLFAALAGPGPGPGPHGGDQRSGNVRHSRHAGQPERLLHGRQDSRRIPRNRLHAHGANHHGEYGKIEGACPCCVVRPYEWGVYKDSRRADFERWNSAIHASRQESRGSRRLGPAVGCFGLVPLLGLALQERGVKQRCRMDTKQRLEIRK